MFFKSQKFPSVVAFRTISLFNFIFIAGLSSVFAQTSEAPQPILVAVYEQSSDETAKPKLNSVASANCPPISENGNLKSETAGIEAKIGAMEKKAFDLLNQKRLENNLPGLIWDAPAARLARKHSATMAQNNFLSHQDLDGATPESRVRAAQIGKFKGIGENIAFNQGFKYPVEFAVERWQLSIGHRENLMLSDWTSAGIGIAFSESGGFYITQVFLAR